MFSYIVQCIGLDKCERVVRLRRYIDAGHIKTGPAITGGRAARAAK
jgi:hypothetical protein